MLRVLGTLKRSVYAQDFHSQINDLGNWVSEIHGGMYPHLVRSLLCIYPAHLKTSFCLLTGCQRRLGIVTWIGCVERTTNPFQKNADGLDKTKRSHHSQNSPTHPAN